MFLDRERGARLLMSGRSLSLRTLIRQRGAFRPSSIERLITEKTRAVIPVGLYGLPADMPAIRKVTEKFKVHLIEDAAQSLGGKYSGKMSGSAADIAAFSFHGTKTLTTGEGGMFVTDDEAIFERAQFLRDHGRSRANYKNFFNTEVAYKYRMSDLQAAFGLAQLERIDELLEKKRRISNGTKYDLRTLE